MFLTLCQKAEKEFTKEVLVVILKEGSHKYFVLVAADLPLSFKCDERQYNRSAGKYCEAMQRTVISAVD